MCRLCSKGSTGIISHGSHGNPVSQVLPYHHRHVQVENKGTERSSNLPKVTAGKWQSEEASKEQPNIICLCPKRPLKPREGWQLV